jgi:hypothetical protein
MTQLFSQNGWPVGLDRASIDVHNYQVPGTKRYFAVNSHVAPILIAFAAEYHKLVQPIDSGIFDDWGYNAAVIPNTKVYSNHASGTAIDINATCHPWKTEASANFTSMQIAAVHALVKKYSLRWGADYLHGFTDPMHFEITRSQSAVASQIATMKLTMPKVAK